MAGNPMSIRVARARREQSALTDPYNQNNRNYGNQEIFSRNDQYNDYQTDRRPGKVETNTRRKLPSNDSAMAIKNIRKNFSFALVIPHISLNSFDQSHFIFSFFFRVSRVFILERCRVGGRLFVVFCLGPLLLTLEETDMSLIILMVAKIM